MILTIEEKLRSIQRSLESVIIPAIDPDAGQAREQAQFAAMHCNAMLEQMNWAYAMEVAEAEHFAELCRTLAAIAPRHDVQDLDALLALADSYGSGRPHSQGDVRKTVLALRERADALLLAALEAGDAAGAASEAVLSAARRHEIRTRAWVQDSSYETGDVPALSIKDSLDPGRIDALTAR